MRFDSPANNVGVLDTTYFFAALLVRAKGSIAHIRAGSRTSITTNNASS
jgi:hypothetical protein